MPTYEPGPTSVALCGDFTRKARQQDAALPVLNDQGGGGFPLATFDTTCLPTPRGAWAIEVGAVRPTSAGRGGKRTTERLDGSFHAVHLDLAGQRASGPPIPFVASEWASFDVSLALFDYDADGEPELLLHVQTIAHTGTGVATQLIFTTTGGLRRYPPADAFAATMADDIDSDGRPDLLYAGEEPSRIEGTPTTPHTSVMPEFLWVAHAVPDGTFSARDGVARDYVRTQCPASPTLFVVMSNGSIDEEASLKSVHCARAWGVSTADIEAQIVRDCEAPKRPDHGRKEAKTCANYGMMLAWAQFTPPVLLNAPLP